MIDLPSSIREFRDLGKTHFHAIADNLDFEERLSGARLAAYTAHKAPVSDPGWDGHHQAYIAARVNVSGSAVPETFTDINDTAHIGEIEDNQSVVRMEEIDWVLKSLAIDMPKLVHWMALVNGTVKGRGTDLDDARDALDELVEGWNRLRDNRPIFAGFEDDVSDDLGAADWANRLRDRWGLGHYDPPAGSRINVALMRYTVRDVRRGVPASRRAATAFAYPCALDARLNPYFFPAPDSLPFGRTLDLQPDGNCERHVAEILHQRIDYKRSHIVKLGAISAPRPRYPLNTRRNDHLYCLQFHSNRDDFGQAIPDHVVD